MDINLLDEKVSFENPAFADDGSGGQTETFVQWLADCWARVQKKSGYINFNEGHESSVSRYDVYVRYRHLIEMNLKEKYTRIIYCNKRFSIDSSELIDEKKKYYHFTVTAIN